MINCLIYSGSAEDFYTERPVNIKNNNFVKEKVYKGFLKKLKATGSVYWFNEHREKIQEQITKLVFKYCHLPEEYSYVHFKQGMQKIEYKDVGKIYPWYLQIFYGGVSYQFLNIDYDRVEYFCPNKSHIAEIQSWFDLLNAFEGVAPRIISLLNPYYICGGTIKYDASHVPQKVLEELSKFLFNKQLLTKESFSIVDTSEPGKRQKLWIHGTYRLEDDEHHTPILTVRNSRKIQEFLNATFTLYDLHFLKADADDFNEHYQKQCQESAEHFEKLQRNNK